MDDVESALADLWADDAAAPARPLVALQWLATRSAGDEEDVMELAVVDEGPLGVRADQTESAESPKSAESPELPDLADLPDVPAKSSEAPASEDDPPDLDAIPDV